MSSGEDKKSEEDDELLKFLAAKDRLQLPMVDLSCCRVPGEKSSAKPAIDEEVTAAKPSIKDKNNR